jgi:hypothetical protein
MEWWTDILLNGTVRFLLEFLSRERVAESLNRVAERVLAGRSVVPAHSHEFDVMAQVAGVVHDWVTDPLTTTGDPLQPTKSLWLNDGTPTLTELVERRFPKEDVPEIIRRMQEEVHVVKRHPDGSFRLTRAASLVLVGPNVTSAAQRFATIVTRLFWSGLTNLRSGGDETFTNLERTSHIKHLPVKYIPTYLRLAKELGQALLESINSYLEDHDDPTSIDPTVEAGMHIYTYYGSPTLADSGTMSHQASTEDKPLSQ